MKENPLITMRCLLLLGEAKR